MSTSNYYDLIVLGSDLAGLAAAALVARRGKRVLVLPIAPLDGVDTSPPDPVVCDPTPVLCGDSAIFRRVFDELGVWQQIRRERQPIAGKLHLALPSGRLDLDVGLANLDAELDRERPGSDYQGAWEEHQRRAAACEAAWEELIGNEQLSNEGLWERRGAAKIAAHLPDVSADELHPLAADHPLRACARAMLPALSHLTPMQLGRAAALYHASQWERGPEDLAGGVPRLRAFLLDRLLTHGGEVKTGLRVAELLVQRGRVSGVAFFGKRDHYGCEHMIIADDPALVLGDLGPVDALRAALGIPLHELAVVARRYILHLEVDVAGLSPALDGLVINQASPREGSSGHGVGTSYIRVDPTVIGDARRLAITHIIAPDERLEHLRERLLDRLDRAHVLPYVHEHVRWSYSAHDGRGALDGRGRSLAELPPELRPTAMDPILASVADPPPLGVALLPHTTDLRNLFLAGRAVLPGLGLVGELAVAVAVAGSIVAPGRARSRPLFLGR